MPTQQAIEAVTQRVKNLRQLEENLTKTLSTRVNELHEECFKAMTTDSDNMSKYVTFRLDCFSEFLQNLLIKVQDASQHIDIGQDTSQYTVGLKSLLERMDKLEAAAETEGSSNEEARILELQSEVNELKRITEQIQQGFPIKGSNQWESKIETELSTLKEEVGRTNAETKLLKDSVGLQVERIDSEKSMMETYVKGEIERINREKESVEDEVERLDSEHRLMERYTKEEIERIDKEKLSVNSHLEKEVERIGSESKCARSEVEKIGKKTEWLEEKLKRLDSERKVAEKYTKEEIGRINTETVEMKAYLEEEVERIDARNEVMEKHHKDEVEKLNKEKESVKKMVKKIDEERTTMGKQMEEEVERMDQERQILRANLRKNVSSQKTLKKVFSKKQDESKEVSRVLAKKVSSLEVLKDGLNQLTQNLHSGPKALKMIQDAQTEIASLKTSFGSLDAHLKQINCPSVGFSASIPYRQHLVIQPNSFIGSQLHFDHIIGNCIKYPSNDFAAPHKGLYVFHVNVQSNSEEEFRIFIMSKKAGGTFSTAKTLQIVGCGYQSTACVIELQKDTSVSLFCLEPGSVKLLNYSGFFIGCT